MNQESTHAPLPAHEWLAQNRERLIRLWEAEARKKMTSARQISELALRDSLPGFIEKLETILSPSAAKPSIVKESKGHAQDRAQYLTYSVDQVILEFQLLRYMIYNILEENAPVTRHQFVTILETVDEAIRTAGAEFVRIQLSLAEMAQKEAELAAQRLKDLQAIAEVALSKSPDLERLLRDLVGVVQRAFRTDTATILLVVDENKTVTVQTGYGLDPEKGKDEQQHIAAGDGAVGQVMANGKSVIIDDLSRVHIVSPGLQNGELSSLMAAPLQLGPKTIGVVHTGSVQSRKFSRDDLVLLELMAERIAIAVDHGRLYAKAQADVTDLEAERETRERFVAALTHDLRSPLTGINVAAQLIRLYPDKADVRERALARIEQSMERADTLIEDLLDANRLHAGHKLPIEINAMDLRALIKDLSEDLSATYGRRFVFAEGEATPGHWCARSLRRAIENLMTNAIKYGERGSLITLNLVSDSSGVTVSVHNQGPPIAEGGQKTLFEYFKRAPEVEKLGKPGWGIGLTIVKGVAEAHGGQVSVKSFPESGTTFSIWLPRDSRPFVNNPSILI
jgi:signal transduction histidine kinase